MLQEYIAEWSGLMDHALSVIRTGAQVRERGTRRAFQLVVIPTFDVVTSWELFRSSSTGPTEAFDVAVVSWDQPADAEKFRAPTERLKYGPSVAPATRLRRVSVPAEHARSMIASLGSVRVPFLPGEHPIGADGTMFRISVGDPFAGSSFEWWESGPKAWSDLVNAVQNIHSTLSRLVPQA